MGVDLVQKSSEKLSGKLGDSKGWSKSRAKVEILQRRILLVDGL